MAEDKKGKESKEANNEEKRCFVMMPISDQGDYLPGHFDKVYNQIFKPAIEKAGYKPYRVDENTISDSIVNKIFEAIQNCEMALCDLSNRNPNVLYELGLRQAYNKPVVLVCDDKTDKIFDVSGISTVFYKSDRLYENVLEAQDEIYEAMKSTGEGKAATLVQVVHATEANYNSESMGQIEKTEIILQSIMRELRELNNKNDNNNAIVNLSKEYKRMSINVDNRYGLDVMMIRNIFDDAYGELGNVSPITVIVHDNNVEIVFDYNEYKKVERTINKFIHDNVGSIRYRIQS